MGDDAEAAEEELADAAEEGVLEEDEGTIAAYFCCSAGLDRP